MMKSRLALTSKLKWIFCASCLLSNYSHASALPKPLHIETRPGNATRVGLFNSPAEPVSSEYGSQGTRISLPLIQLSKMTQSVLDGNPNEAVREIVGFNQSKMVVAITLGYPFPEKPNVTRVPVGDDRANSLKIIREFVRTLGTYVNYIAVHNESYIGAPFSLNARTLDANGKYPALEWMAEVARAIQEEKVKDPDRLAHLKVSSCAFTDLYEYANDLYPRWGDFKKQKGPDPFVKALMNWVDQDPNIDVVDLHMHEDSPKSCLDVLNYAKSFTKKNFIVTEWSPSEMKHEWMDQSIQSTLPDFFEKYKDQFGLNEQTTHDQFIKKLYKHPTTSEIWNEYVSQWGYDPSFWRRAYDLMNESRAEILFVGQYLQVGSPIFDAKQIMASKTVEWINGKPQSNWKFGDYFKDLTTYVRVLQNKIQ
jgi:hypothetical protein